MNCFLFFQDERFFFCFRHYTQSKRWRVPAISSNGYTTDHWRWGDPGTYETVLGGEPGWETRLSRDKENHAQSSRQQRHVSDQLYCILIRQIFCISQLSGLRQTLFVILVQFFLARKFATNVNQNFCFCYLRSFIVFIWHWISAKRIPELLKCPYFERK